MSGETLYIQSQRVSQDDDDSPMEAVDDEDAWDDSLLIKAYNKAVDMAKEKIAKKMSQENDANPSQMIAAGKTALPKKKAGKTKHSQQTTIGWTVGMPCRAIYSSDGLEYEATISSVNSSSGTCVVVYYGYNNEEEVDLSSLKPSRGENARSAQEAESHTDDLRTANGLSPSPRHRRTGCFNGEALGAIPPPPPPNVMAHFPKDESDALSAMLMAWYMSGYHTGYFQGLTHVKTTRPNGVSHPSSARPN
ncbi:Survival motor neuron [Nesidiocoris tenuis]|uniref:Survival motor neuron n=1 Tax=Nesidiocoris tenuis TaxID=355587 RepID=A0ABN7AUR6_9HEMI|nr:Survival motor neuron [Nesidiocoris tenuis]